VPTKDGKRLREQILEGAEQVEDEESGPDGVGGGERGQFFSSFPPTHVQQVMLIDPGQFRVINELLQKECKGKGKLETLTFAATAQTN
jgi:ribosome maturation protein SDO1